MDPEAFRPEHARARGVRRPLTVPVREASLEVERGGRSVLVRFVLPPGAFATVLLAAVTGASGDPPADEAQGALVEGGDVPDAE